MNVRNWIAGWLLLGLLLPGALHAQDAPEPYTQAELDQMLAPVALYPDTVLSHILIAATYPLEVVQAARWTEQHPELEGDAALDAVADKDWDESVKALVAFPDILERMHEDLDWTQDLGEAFLAQEKQVLDTIQGLRHRADNQDTLESNEHVKVVREREVIYIEPRSPRVVYVPYYDPRVVYGSWWWPAHPPVYWSYPHGYHSSIGFHWSRGYRVSPFFFSSSFHWFNRHVVIIHHHHIHRGHYRSARQISRHEGAKRWKHKPRHRRNVPYRTASPRLGTVPRGDRHVQRSERRDWAKKTRQGLNRTQRSRPDPAHVRNRTRVQSEPTVRSHRPGRTRRGTDTNRVERPDTAVRAPHSRPNASRPNVSRPQVQSRPQAQSRPRLRSQPQSRQRPATSQRPSIESRPTVRTQAEPRIAAPKPPRASRQQHSAQSRSTPKSSPAPRSTPRKSSAPSRKSNKRTSRPTPRASSRGSAREQER